MQGTVSNLNDMRRRQAATMDRAMESCFSAFNLRRLFRALDTDNNRVISQGELFTALKAMGMIRDGEEAIVAHLVADMDRNRSGVVKEEEFLSVFRGLTPLGLSKWLDEIRARVSATDSPGAGELAKKSATKASKRGAAHSTGRPHAVVTVAEFGREFAPGQFARIRQMTVIEALAWLRRRQEQIEDWTEQMKRVEDGAEAAGDGGFPLQAPSDVVSPMTRFASTMRAHQHEEADTASGSVFPEPLASCWLDVQGLDISLLQDLGDVFGYGVETAKDAAVYQRAKAEVVLGAAAEHTHHRITRVQTARPATTDAAVDGTGTKCSTDAAAAPVQAVMSSTAHALAPQLAAQNRFQCLLHRMWLRHDSLPIRPAPSVQSMAHPQGSRSRASAVPGSEFLLRSRRDLAQRPPELLLSQISVIVVDDWTVLTVRGAGDSSVGRSGGEGASKRSGSVSVRGAGCCSCLCGACDDAADSCCAGTSSSFHCCSCYGCRFDCSPGEQSWLARCCCGGRHAAPTASRRAGHDAVRRGGDSSVVSAYAPDVVAAEMSWSDALRRAEQGGAGELDSGRAALAGSAAAERRELLAGLGVFGRVASRLERGGGGVSSGGAAALLGCEQEPAADADLAAGGDGRVSLARAASAGAASGAGAGGRRTGAAKAVSLELIDAVLDQCYQVRDVLKDWQEAVEASLTAPGTVPLPLHTAHLFGLSKISELYQRSLRPLLTDLKTPEVRQFFERQGPEVRDTVDDLSTMLGDVSSTIAITARLRELYSSLSNDMMNRALFVLTITTTTIMPVQVFSGIFGMNFAFMPELAWEYSYTLFWVFTLLMCAIIFIWFVSKGYFALFAQGAAADVIPDHEDEHRGERSSSP